MWSICLIGPASHRGHQPSRRTLWQYRRHKAPPAPASAPSTPPHLGDGVWGAPFKQGGGGRAENSDLALHKESLVKRRGEKVARVTIQQKKRCAAKATIPPSSWRVKEDGQNFGSDLRT